MPPRFEFVAGLLCLDFVNTQVLRAAHPHDLLPDPAALDAWLVEAGLADRGGPAHGGAGRRAAASRQARRTPAEGAALLRTARGLRRAIQRSAERLRDGRAVATADLAVINAVLAAAPAVTRVDRAGGVLAMRSIAAAASPAGVLAPVAASAAEMITTLDPTRIGTCGADDCIRWFYDTTRNHGRRWCTMEGCGNRAKVAAHYYRIRAAAVGGRRMEVGRGDGGTGGLEDSGTGGR